MAIDSRETVGRKTRKIVETTTRPEALLIGRALQAYSDMLCAVDRDFPNPDQRELARMAKDLAAYYFRANQARDFIEEKDR